MWLQVGYRNSQVWKFVYLGPNDRLYMFINIYIYPFLVYMYMYVHVVRVYGNVYIQSVGMWFDLTWTYLVPVPSNFNYQTLNFKCSIPYTQ